MQIGRHEYTVVRPRIRDPRFHLAAVIISLHVLGQTVLEFDISIAQILIAVGTAATIGFTVSFVRDKTIAWPASAVLAGNGVAFILRVPGTRHGDWWSTQGWWIFAGTAAVALASKYLIRWRDGHIFNPSNFGLVVCFLVLGSDRAEPLDFWWGPVSARTLVALAVIGIGGVAILIRLRIATIAVSFWVTFAATIGVLTAAGHCMTARWHLGPVCGRELWWVLVTSPEILVFLFFMITDPRTSPKGNVARAVYGVSIASIASILVAPQTTEFATKTAVLTSLAIVCALRPVFESRLPAAGDPDDHLLLFLRPGRRPDGRPSPRPEILGVGAVFLVLALVAATAGADASKATTTVANHARDTNGMSLPPITVETTDRVASFIDQPTARAITSDVIDDLAVIERAQQRTDSTTLHDGSAEAWLGRLLTMLGADRAHHTTTVERYEVQRVTIGLARRPGQGAPAVLITLHGTMQHVEKPTARSPGVLVTKPSVTWEVKYIGKRYLITTDNLPPGYTSPN